MSFIPIWKVSYTTPPYLRIYSWYMIIFLHIYTPWIKQYCFICSSPFSTNLVILVQATICRCYVCKIWKLSNEYFLHDIHFKSSIFPQFCVQSYRRLTHRLHPTTIYSLMHNFYYFVSYRFQSFVIKKSKKISLIWYQTYLDMWSIFGVKLKGVLHLLPKISVFCTLCQNYQHLFEK